MPLVLKSSVNCQVSSVRKTAGFTLIELLIVITILGILASLTLASYGGTQERARDSKRKQELDAIKKSLELAKQDTPGAYYYPGCSVPAPCGGSQTSPALSPTYIKVVPLDPKTKTDYVYSPTGCATSTQCTGYSLAACLENNNDPQGVTDATNCPTSPNKAYTITPN
jgi:prepilin-type N-terminal cleavage/methylation domain-containing protein